MRQALHKRIVVATCQQVAIIVVRMMVDVDHRRRDVANPVAEQIDGHHREGMLVSALLHDVLLPRILGTQILAEAQGLRLQPGLLQFDEHHMLPAVLFADGGTEVYAKQRDVVTRDIGILVWPLHHLHHPLLQQGRQDGAGNALVLHQVLEHRVIDRVRYIEFHAFSPFRMVSFSVRPATQAFCH